MRLRLARVFALLGLVLLTAQVAHSDPPLATKHAATPARLDRFGDPLPDGAVFRIGTTRYRWGEGNPSMGLILSPDGKFVLCAGSTSRGVCMGEVATGRPVRRFPSRDSSPVFALSADGSILAIADRGHIHLLDAGSGKKRRTLDSPAEIQSSYLAFSPDGKILTSFQWISGTSWCRWETATGKLIRAWEMDEDVPLALSADARVVASLGRRKRMIRLWEASSGKKIREWKTEEAVALWWNSMAFSPDGRSLAAAGENGRIRVYETATGEETRSWKAWTRKEESEALGKLRVFHFVFAPDGKTLASVDSNGFLRLWEWKTGRQLHQFVGVSGPVAFSADGKVIAAGGEDARIRLWDTATGRDLCPFVDPGGIRRVAFAPSGRVLVVGTDRPLVHLLAADSGRSLRCLTGYSFLALSPDGGSFLARRRDRSLCLVGIGNGEETAGFRGTEEDSFLDGWDPSKKIVVTCNRSFVRTWNTMNGTLRREICCKEE